MPKILLVIEGPTTNAAPMSAVLAKNVESAITGARVEVEIISPRNETLELVDELAQVLTAASRKLEERSVDACVYFATNTAVFKNSTTGLEKDGCIVHIACAEINNCGAVHCHTAGTEALSGEECKRLFGKIREDGAQALQKLGIEETPFSRELVALIAASLGKTSSTHH